MIYQDNVRAILIEMWPSILLISVILISMRTFYIIKNKEKALFYKEMMSYLFIIYILCLFYVVTFHDVSWSESNFTPFKEIMRYNIGSKLFFKNVIGNMVMFVPFGFFVSYFLKLKKVYSITFFTVITSVTIEFTQLLIGRVFDVDDLILNLIGGIVGFGIYRLIHNIKDKSPSFLKKDYIYNIIMLLLFGLMIFYVVKVVI